MYSNRQIRPSKALQKFSLLACGECEHNYRRITRSSGEIVWRCANRVEHGKRLCKHSPTIPEQLIKDAICEKLNLVVFDEYAVKKRIDFITIQPDGTLEVEMQQLGLLL